MQHRRLIFVTLSNSHACASNWEWRRLQHARGDGDGPKFGCFAITSMDTGAKLHPPLLFSGVLISEQQVAAIVESCDADLVISLPSVANGVAIDGRGSICFCERQGGAGRPVRQCATCVQCTSVHRWQQWNEGHAGAQHIRLPLVHSLTKGYRLEKRKANCIIVGEDRHVEIVRHVSQGCELLVDADAPRAAAVIDAYVCRDLFLSNVVVLVATRPGVPRKSNVSDFEYANVSTCALSTWAEGKIVYCYSAATHGTRSSAVSQGARPVAVYNGGDFTVHNDEGDFTHAMCRAGDILHWEDVDNVEQRGFSWSEPPSEYVELVDSTTGNSVFLVHPGHLRNQNERYVETRKAFGQYVVVNLKKPLREIGVNAELIDRVITPGEINGQADKHKKFAAYIDGKLQASNVVVHCCNTRSRTPAVVAVWLMVHRGFSLHTATRMLTELYEDQRPSIVSRSVDCPNFVRFQLLLERVEQSLQIMARSPGTCNDDPVSDPPEPLESPPSPVQSPPRKKNIGLHFAPSSSPTGVDISAEWSDTSPDTTADTTAAVVDTSPQTFWVLPQTRVVELAEQVISTSNGARLSAADIKAGLYQAGHADLFEQCYSLGAGDMLEAIEAAIVRRYGAKDGSEDTGIEHTTELDHSNRRQIEELLRRGQRYAANDGTGIDVADWLQEAEAAINVHELSDSCDSSDSSSDDSNPGAHQCEMMLPKRRVAQCHNMTEVKQGGRWLCRIHILPECSLEAHCLFVTGKPLQPHQWKTTAGRRGREVLQQPVQLTDAMRDHIRQRFGAHAVSSRDQFVCRRCIHGLNKSKAYRGSNCQHGSPSPAQMQAQQTAAAIEDMRKQYGRSGPWLQFARLQSQLNKANATNVQLQSRVSEVRRTAASEKHDMRVAAVALQTKISADKRVFACAHMEQQAKHRRVLSRSVGANRKLTEQNARLKAKEKQLAGRLLESTNLQSGHIRERISRCVATATAKMQKQLANSQDRVHKLHEKQAELTDTISGWKSGRASLANEQRQNAQETQSKIHRSYAAKLSNKTAALRVTMQQKVNEERAKKAALRTEYENKLLEVRAATEAGTTSLRAEKNAIVQELSDLQAQYNTQSAELKRERSEHKLTTSKVRTKLHLSRRTKETFADLVAQKHMLGAGRGYSKQGTSCEPARMPVDGRTRADRGAATLGRNNTRRKLARRVQQFENEACEALGIDSWPPKDPKVLSELGIGQAEQSKMLHQQLAEQSKMLQQQLNDVSTRVVQLTRDNETTISRVSQQFADKLTCLEKDHASDIAQLEQQSKVDLAELEQKHAAALKASLSDSTSSKLKIVGHASVRDYERMADVLNDKNVPCKKYWKQLKEERDMRFRFPITRMLLDSSQCRKSGCTCSRHHRIMGNMSETQRFDLCAKQCLAFTKCVTTYVHRFRLDGKFNDVVRQILTYVLDAQTPLTRHSRLLPQAKIRAAHDQAMSKYAMSRCPAAVGMDIVEAMQHQMLLAHTTGLADSFFFPDDVGPGADAGMSGAGADWYTPEVKQRCKFSETVKLNRAAGEKCPALAVFCFDGTRIGRDFQRPLQQHSWKFANSQSLSVDEVWLTHLCLVDEKKEVMTPIFRSVHSQLERPEAHKITVKGQERPVDFMCVCDCKANLQVLNQQSNSAHYACAICTMRSEYMYDIEHQRFTLHAMEHKLSTLRQTRNVRQITEATFELEQRRAEMGVSRTPEMAELAARRIKKLVETCSIESGIDYGHLNAHMNEGQPWDKMKYANRTLDNHANLLDASCRLSCEKVLQVYERCMDDEKVRARDQMFFLIRVRVAQCLEKQDKTRKARRRSKTMLSAELYLRLHTLCRVAGPDDLGDLCETCRDSVKELCHTCKGAQTQLYMAQRDNGAAGVPMWVLPAEDCWRDNDFKYRTQIRALANGTLRSGDSCKTIGDMHYANPDNACVRPTSVDYPCRQCKPCARHASRSLTCMYCTEHMYKPQHCSAVSERYETYGQVGKPSLRGLDNTAIAPDLLHTVIDLTMTIAKWLIRCAEGCGTESDGGKTHLYNLGECLVDTNIKAFAWGPLVNMSVSGRHTPTRDAMNGPECKFLCDHSDLILDRTFGKTPVVGGNAHTCKQTMATGMGHLQRLRKWILCKDWQQLLDAEQLSVNPLVELQRSYEALQRWLLTEVANPVNTNAAIQLGGARRTATTTATRRTASTARGGDSTTEQPESTAATLFQGIAWHNCSHMVYDVAPFIWDTYRLSIGCVTSCQPFEGINRSVKEYFNNHSNNHVGQGLEDNCAALGLQGMCAYRYVLASLPRRAASQETCPMCNPATGCLGTKSFGETPGQNGRCMRYPLCRDCKEGTVEHHVRRTSIACPHHARYKPLCRQ